MRMLDKKTQIPEFPEQFACTDHIEFDQIATLLIRDRPVPPDKDESHRLFIG